MSAGPFITMPNHKAAKFHHRHVRCTAVVGAMSKFESVFDPGEERICDLSSGSSSAFLDEENRRAIGLIVGSLKADPRGPGASRAPQLDLGCQNLLQRPHRVAPNYSLLADGLGCILGAPLL